MTTSAKILAVDFSALLERGKYMRKYIVVLKEEYIRDAQIFYPEGINDAEFEELSEEDIYLSSVFESAWVVQNLTGYLCVIAVPKRRLAEKLQEIAKKYHYQMKTLEAIPVDTGNQEGWDKVSGKYGRAEKLIEANGAEGFIQLFYDFLLGKMHPDTISRENSPDLTKEQAWHVIYCMQEYFGIFDDRFERCKICDSIYDSDKGGTVINQDTEPVEIIAGSGTGKLQDFIGEEYRDYCEECRVD